MAFPLRDTPQGGDVLSPMRIARHRLFTAREKLSLLEELRAGVSVALARERDPGLSPVEIERATDEVRRAMERGESRPAGPWKH